MTTDDSPSGPDDGDDLPADPIAEESGDKPGATPDKKRKHLPVWQESLLLIGVALVLAVVIKAFFVQAFYIPSPSMEPGLIKNDRILVQKVSYWFGGSPSPGDVVVFKDPGQWLGPEDTPAPTGRAKLLSKIGLYPTGGHLVKRVIGAEGDVVICCDEEGRIQVNGLPLDEDYLGPDPGPCNGALDEGRTERGTRQDSPCAWSIGPIPKGKLFVLGDNRGHSGDSRVHMCAPSDDPCTESPWVDADLVVGKVFSLIWPHDRWTWVNRPGIFGDVPDEPSESVLEQAENPARGASTDTANPGD